MDDSPLTDRPRSLPARLLETEWRALRNVSRSDRPWQSPLAVAAAVAIPLLTGALCDQMMAGALGSIGGLSAAYLPRDPLPRRLRVLALAGVAMVLCHAWGQLAYLLPALRIAMLGLLTLAVVLTCRVRKVAPPGPVFFVMAAALAAHVPATPSDLLLRSAYVAAGAVGAFAIGTLYSLYILRRRAPVRTKPPLPARDLQPVLIDSLIVAFSVGASLALAEAFALERPYWVAVSCLAVIRGVTLRGVWTLQLHRILGTVVGLALAFALLSLSRSDYWIAGCVFVLLFAVEMVIARHYAVAVIFITPLTIMLADAATIGAGSAGSLMTARLVDTVIGALFGFLGGAAIHTAAIRRALAAMLAPVLPRRFRS